MKLIFKVLSKCCMFYRSHVILNVNHSWSTDTSLLMSFGWRQHYIFLWAAFSHEAYEIYMCQSQIQILRLTFLKQYIIISFLIFWAVSYAFEDRKAENKSRLIISNNS